MKIFECESRLEAWLLAARHLIQVECDLNVILNISNPVTDGPNSALAYRKIDEFLRGEGQYSLHTVAETIFPGWQYKQRGLRGVFETYPDEEYPRIKDKWGRYAYRLVRRQNAEGQQINPLKQLIDKMRSELSYGGKGAKHACYELGVAEGEYDMPLYDTVDHAGYRRGGPCLSHLSFKLYEGAVHLAAIYRSHDYRFKALGNLLGLARLQACVARETGAGTGGLVVHSTYAYLESGRGKRKFAGLLDELELLRTKEVQNGLAIGL